MKYKLCPKCNLNYIPDDAEECSVCSGKNQVKSVQSRINAIKRQIVVRRNIAFKCNYCDGGKADNDIGFNGVCSDFVIDHNIKDKKTWCCSENCHCKHYFDGQINRQQLEKAMSSGEFVCYESNLLSNWIMGAGYVVKGKHKGEPNRLLGVKSGSLCVLTTVFPNDSSQNRYIFGAFIVKRSNEGDDTIAGDVESSEYRIMLTEKETRKMNFWNYYKNKSDKAPNHWGTGLFRYLSDEQSLHILDDLVKLKKGSKDEMKANNILAYYLETNKIKSS